MATASGQIVTYESVIDALTLSNSPFPFTLWANENIAADTWWDVLLQSDDINHIIDAGKTWVRWNYGHEDARSGAAIRSRIIHWIEHHHLPESETLEKMRRGIWGDTRRAGEDFYSYQPEPPVRWTTPSEAAWEQWYNSLLPDKLREKVTRFRWHLSHKVAEGHCRQPWTDYVLIDIAHKLGVDPGFLAKDILNY